MKDGGAAKAAVCEEHLFSEGLMIGGNDDRRGDTRQITVLILFFLRKNEWDERGARSYNLHPELARQIVALRGGADFGDRKTTGGDDQDWGAKVGRAGSHNELSRALNFLNFDVEKGLDGGAAAFGFQHIGDVLCGSVAKKLAERFFVVRDAMLFYKRDEIRRSVAGERGFREVFVGAEEIFGVTMEVCEIAAAAAGDEDFLADAIGALEDRDAATALASFDGAEESRGAGAEDEGVKIVRWLRQAFDEPRGCKVCLRSLLRLN